jgi:hypothetical protein
MLEPVVDVPHALEFMKQVGGLKLVQATSVPGVVQAGNEEGVAECMLVRSC